MTQIDNELVRQLAGILNETGLTEIEYDTGGLRIRVARNVQHTVLTSAAPVAHGAGAHHVPAAAPAAVSDPASHPGALKAPMVGVAYLLPEPGAPPFAKVGDQVTEGQTICLIEAMKTFNPVKAHRSGKLIQVLVENGAPVEYGEPLAIIE
ncbi:MAG: acetyl-CoA carboxylase biotin carboxyl carrier protein [Rhodospirillaceae bacterium]|nr:MAG: acetyl-CoA carboxylase biotin carboxyl carrier protein [Rhodospirillaceae bacterium]